MSRPLGVAVLVALALGAALADGCYVAVSYDKVDGTAGGDCAEGGAGTAGASASLPACGGAGGTAGAGGAAGGAGAGGGG